MSSSIYIPSWEIYPESEESMNVSYFLV